MRTIRFLPLTLLSALLLGACSSMPAGNSTLDQARSDYSSAQANPRVAEFAAGELRQANDTLLKADTAWKAGEDSGVVTHLAYVARQQVAIAQQTASQKSDERAIANAGAERDRVRLDARTREADMANRDAAQAQRQAESSQRQSETSQRQAEASRRNADALQRQSESSLRSAEESQRVAAQATQAAANSSLDAQAAGQRTSEAEQRTLDAEQRARQLELQLRDLEARPTPRGMVITLGDVLFDTNEARLKPSGVRSVQKLAEFFRQYPQRKVLIEGFTDSTGSSNRNDTLSQDRAGAVRLALLDMGVSADRIGARGYGEAYPVASNDTTAGRQMNRRVEIIVSDDRGNVLPR